MCCCFCCPAYGCALALCIFEIVISVTIWFNTLDLISKTLSTLQLKDILILLFMTSWLITLFTSTFTLVLAHYKKRSEFVLPRLVQQCGLLIIGFLVTLLVIIYFSGGSMSINNAIIFLYENLLLEHPLSTNERRETHDALKYCFMVLIMLDFIFICYMAFGLSMTKKFHKQLKQTEYLRTPQSVEHTPTHNRPPPPPLTTNYAKPFSSSQQYPSAPPPPPPYNPNYKVPC